MLPHFSTISLMRRLQFRQNQGIYRICILFLLMPLPGAAYEEEELELKDLLALSIEELVKVPVHTLNKRKETFFEVPAAIYVLTREDIRASGALSVPDLLLKIPGVYVRQTSNTQHSISIRNDNQTYNTNMQVLIDGKSYYLPQTNNVLWSILPIAVEDIERIEVVRGNGGVAWGSNASSGVVNIVTRYRGRRSSNAAEVRADVGNLVYRRLHYRGQNTNTTWSVHTEYHHGYEDSDVRSKLGYVSLNKRQKISAWDSLFQVKYFEREQEDFPGFLGTIDAEYESYDYSFRIQKRTDRTEIELLAYQLKQETDFPLFGNQDLSQYAREYELNLLYKLPKLHRFQLTASNKTYDRSEATESIVIKSIPVAVHESFDSAMLAYEFPLFTISRLYLGVRYENYSLTPGAQYSYSLRYQQKRGGDSMYWLSLNRSHQYPSFISTNLQATLPSGQNAGTPVYVVQRGNPDLATEMYKDIQVGFRRHNGRRQYFDFSAYFQEVVNEIFVDSVKLNTISTPTAVYQITQFDNFVQSRTWGVELDWDYRHHRKYRLRAGLSYFRKTLRAQDELDRPPFNHSYAPRWKFTVDNQFKQSSRSNYSLLLDWESSHQNESRSIYYPSEVTGTRIRIDAHWGYQANKSLLLSMGLKNLLNQQVDWQYEFVSAEPQRVETEYYYSVQYSFDH